MTSIRCDQRHGRHSHDRNHDQLIPDAAWYASLHRSSTRLHSRTRASKVVLVVVRTELTLAESQLISIRAPSPRFVLSVLLRLPRRRRFAFAPLSSRIHLFLRSLFPCPPSGHRYGKRDLRGFKWKRVAFCAIGMLTLFTLRILGNQV